MRISEVQIKRFRSITDLTIKLDSEIRLATICGANNTGKTNILRAINLFFHPDTYVASADSPHHKFQGSRGGVVFPEVTCKIQKGDQQFSITTSFKLDSFERSGTVTKASPPNRNRTLNTKEINSLLSEVNVYFLESINESHPQLIKDVIDDIYDLEYAKSRFTGLKQTLKDAFDQYTTGIITVLNQLASEINPRFNEYDKNWSVAFSFDSNIQRFRDLITDEINFFINDKSNQSIDGKGAGLQRLANILLHLRIIEKSTSKLTLLLIDEPDAYLHQKLQKQLYRDLKNLPERSQILLTSHSPNFIDTYGLRNTFLVELKIGDEKTYIRSNKKYHALSTIIVDLYDQDGATKIKQYLGIEDNTEVLEKVNLIVEGDADKLYLSELSKLFHIELPKIIVAHGVHNIEKHLEFFNAAYKDKATPKPKILIILDNDNAGREVHNKLHSKIQKLKSITCKLEFVPNFLGEVLKSPNNEMEDFIYPELFVKLSNKVLKKASLNSINENKFCKEIKSPAFKNSGVISLLETHKNQMNPDNGQKLCFVSSGKASDSAKNSIAGAFNLEADKKLAEFIFSLNDEFPEPKKFLQRISYGNLNSTSF